MTTSTLHLDHRKEDTPPYRGIGEQLLLKVPEVAALCGVSSKTVSRWIESGEIPTIRPLGMGARPMTLVARSDLDVWIDKNRTIHRDQTSAHKPTVTIHGRRFVRS